MVERIDVSGVNVFHRNFRAVQDVTISIEPRAVTALIEPSGCGESTFLRSIVLDDQRLRNEICWSAFDC